MSGSMLGAWTRLTVGKHTGKTFQDIAESDPEYCGWVLRERRSGILGDFEQFLLETFGGIFRFGKYAGEWYSNVHADDPGYCEWAMSTCNPSGPLADFVAYLRQAGDWGQTQTPKRTSCASSALERVSSEFDSPEPRRKQQRSADAELFAEIEMAQAKAVKAQEEARQAKAQANIAKQRAEQAEAEIAAQAKKAKKAKKEEDAKQAKIAKERAEQAEAAIAAEAEIAAEAQRARKAKKEKKAKDQKAKEDAESSECKICMDNPVQTAFVPCGHMLACLACADSLKKKECPMCRKKVKKVLRIFKA